MGALVANAIHDATGARLLQLPMTPERVKAALQKGISGFRWERSGELLQSEVGSFGRL